MKRVGGLWENLCDPRTLTYAAWRAACGKRDRPEIAGFLSELEAAVNGLARALRDGTFRFGDYRTFEIRDPKSRTIHAPPFVDRVVHHAIVAVAGPVFERGAIAHSYACRAGYGQHAALRQVGCWTRGGDWFFKADIAKYYDSVSHDLLRELLARRFRERHLMALFDRLLESYSHHPGHGLPIGALTSQYLGNFYLDPVDLWVKQTCRMRRYVRYMDDLLFLGDAALLREAREALPTVLEGLGLAVKNGGILNRCDLGIPYLGFVLYPNRVRLNRQGRRRLRRRCKTLERDWDRGKLTEAELLARGESLFAHARFGDDVAWRRMVIRYSRFRETQEPDPRPAGRLVEQHRQEVPLGLPQQEEAG